MMKRRTLNSESFSRPDFTAVSALNLGLWTSDIALCRQTLNVELLIRGTG